MGLVGGRWCEESIQRNKMGDRETNEELLQPYFLPTRVPSSQDVFLSLFQQARDAIVHKNSQRLTVS